MGISVRWRLLYHIMLEFLGFGKLQICHAAVTINQYPTRQVEELMAYLLLHPEIEHSREKLIFEFWPDVETDNARHRFTIVLSRLRQLFKKLGLQFEKYIQTTRDWVLFAPERPFSFDRDQFVNHSHLGLKNENIEQREQILQKALHFYRAELFEGIYTQWCLTEREYLARLRLRVLGQLMYGCLQQEAFSVALEYGHLILQEEPLREETHRAMMHCYQQQNRPDLAARQYYQCCALLEQELSILPLPETTRLYTEIMSQRVRSSLTQNPSPYSEKQKIQQAFLAFQAAANALEDIL